MEGVLLLLLWMAPPNQHPRVSSRRVRREAVWFVVYSMRECRVETDAMAATDQRDASASREAEGADEEGYLPDGVHHIADGREASGDTERRRSIWSVRYVNRARTGQRRGVSWAQRGPTQSLRAAGVRDLRVKEDRFDVIRNACFGRATGSPVALSGFRSATEVRGGHGDGTWCSRMGCHTRRTRPNHR